ncbi:uroporphyrinogen decarboxylase [Agromyces soli]
MILDATHPLQAGLTSSSRLVRAYGGERSDTTPVWFMRQAGRSLPEYRELRVGTRMLDACLDPAMAAEITLQPVRRHRVDAGIFFSDIVVPLKLVGVEVSIEPGRGPVFARGGASGRGWADAAAVAELTAIDPALLEERAAPITEAVRRTVAELNETAPAGGAAGGAGAGATPLIGFAGAPFTLAAYLAEGGPSKDHLAARTLMHADPGAWRALMDWTAELTGRFLRTQVLAGASAAQLFDSWAGALSLADYERYVAPASAQALAFVHDLAYEVGPGEAAGAAAGVADAGDATTPGTGGSAGEGSVAERSVSADSGPRPTATRSVPVVHFGVGTGELLGAMHEIGVDTVGVDYRIPLDVAAERVGGGVPLQGNLDPALLAAPWPVLEAAVREVLRRGTAAPAHVFNLGHGVPPETDPAVLTRVVELVHEAGA